MQAIIPKLAACAAALIMLAGCGVSDAMDELRGSLFEKTKFEDDTNYTEVAFVNIVESSAYEPISEITHGYDTLRTESQRQCYALIAQSSYRISEEKDSDGFYPVGKVKVEDKTFSEKDMDVSIKAYTLDHPEVFWLTNRYTYGTAGNQVVIQLYSYLSGEECKQRKAELEEKVNAFIAGIPAGLKQYHLEKYVHNALLDGCTYAKGVETADDGWEEFTAFGALVKGSAVCEGYAHAMCMLLNKVGLDCFYANGYGENAPHIWNTVKINDEWYHLDATWDDNENAYFNYFNLSDERIKTDHIIEPTIDELRNEDTLPSVYNLFLPECSSESANYFVIESTYIEDFEESRDVMVSDLVQAAQNGDDMFTIRINEDIDYKNAIDKMFNVEPYYMFDYIAEANDLLDDRHQINNENLAIIMIENFNSVVVKLEY